MANATKGTAAKALAAKGIRGWVEGKALLAGGYRVRAYEGAKAAFVLPRLVASAEGDFAPDAWAALVRKIGTVA